MKKDMQILPRILASNGIPAYYVIDLKNKVVYEYLLDEESQSYSLEPKKIYIDPINQTPLVLKPMNIEIPFDVIYHPPPN